MNHKWIFDSIQTAVAKFCSLNVEEPIILRVFRKTELTVISRDIDERPLCHGGLTLMVDVKYIDASFRSLPTKVRSDLIYSDLKRMTIAW